MNSAYLHSRAWAKLLESHRRWFIENNFGKMFSHDNSVPSVQTNLSHVSMETLYKVPMASFIKMESVDQKQCSA